MLLTELDLAFKSGRNVVSIQCQLPERSRFIHSITTYLEQWASCSLWNLATASLVVDQESHYCQTPLEVFRAIALAKLGQAFIVEDVHPFLDDYGLRSALINLVADLADSANYVILLGTQEVQLPPILGSIIPEFWNPLPCYEENVQFLQDFGVETDIHALALSAGGLSTEEIKTGLRLVKAQGVSLVEGLLDFKIQRLKAFNLSFIPRPDVGDFGGMDRIRSGIYGVKQDYSHEARKIGIPLPKGWLLVGVPGSGKTFVSKFCASILGFPMIAVDTGAIAAGGASYLRRLIDRIEASAPAVVYFDEMDKLFPDPGVAADVQQRQVLGFLLTWLQDKTSHTFVIATLNRLDSLPPELTRLGRFDEIFYVGFPQAGERKDIMHLHLARFDPRYKEGNSPLTQKEWRIILGQTVNCTGAELSMIVVKAAKKLFRQGLPIQIGLSELLQARGEIVPIFIRDTDRILKIENIAKYVATPCSSPDNSIFAPPEMSLWGQRIAADGTTESLMRESKF